MRRLTSCTLLISSENMATGILWSTAILAIMEMTKAVLPIAGRAAMMTRSEFCHPLVILSSLLNPVVRPERPSSLAAAMLSRSSACLMTGSIWVYSVRMFFCESSKRRPCALCIRSATSTPGSKASVCSMLVSVMICRARYFCWITWAWYSMWAEELTASVRPATRRAPPPR